MTEVAELFVSLVWVALAMNNSSVFTRPAGEPNSLAILEICGISFSEFILILPGMDSVASIKTVVVFGIRLRQQKTWICQ